jgi:hypothetical protein
MSSIIDTKGIMNIFRETKEIELPDKLKLKIPDEFNNMTLFDLFTNIIFNQNYKNKKRSNDIFNKLREFFIEMLLKRQLPKEYNILFYIKMYNDISYAFNTKGINLNASDLNIKIKAGRKYNYDFEITSDGNLYLIEYKYRVSNLQGCPQFLSIGQLNEIMDDDYMHYFFAIFLPHIFMEYKRMFNTKLKTPTYIEYQKSASRISNIIDSMKKIEKKYKENK